MEKKKLLLHTCCASCSLHVAEMLSKDFDVVIYFHNPQIFPKEEYEKRLENARKAARILEVKIVEGEKEHKKWLTAVQGFENEPEGGKRCEICFGFNLEAAAKFAADNGFDAFTTTLTVSPHKNAELINRIGEGLAGKYDAEFLKENFKRNDGFLKSTKKCREHEIYRQNYCGCEFSLKRSIASPKE